MESNIHDNIGPHQYYFFGNLQPGRCAPSKFTVRSRDRIVLQFIGIGLAFVCDHSNEQCSCPSRTHKFQQCESSGESTGATKAHRYHSYIWKWRNFNQNFDWELFMSSRYRSMTWHKRFNSWKTVSKHKFELWSKFKVITRRRYKSLSKKITLTKT